MTEVWDDLLLYYVVLGQAKRNFQPVSATVTPAVIVTTVALPAAAVTADSLVEPAAIVTTAALPAATTAVFNAATVADLRLWLQADSLVLNDADAVASWADNSGNGFDFAQGTGGSQPAYKVNIAASKPVVRFDGTSDLLVHAAADVSTASAGSLFVVACKTNNNDGALFSAGDEGSSTRYIQLLYRTAANIIQYAQQRNNDTADLVHEAVQIMTQNEFTLLEVSSSGTAYTGFFNGTAQTLVATSGSNTGDWFADTSALDNFCVGALKRNTEGNQWQGDIAEILLFDHEVTAGERTTIKTYLATKYHITVA